MTQLEVSKDDRISVRRLTSKRSIVSEKTDLEEKESSNQIISKKTNSINRKSRYVYHRSIARPVSRKNISSKPRIPKKKSKPKIVIVIGGAGLGKSTFIQSSTNEYVEVSNGEESCTFKSNLYQHKQNKLIWFCDTIGTQDTYGKSEVKILKEMCEKTRQKGERVVVIWFVTPNTRSVKQLKNEARFINALNKNIWNGSIAIICKKGMGDEDHQGARAAAREYTNANIPTYNLHVMDLVKDYKTNTIYKHAYKVPLKERAKDHPLLLMKSEVFCFSNHLIQKLIPCKIGFKLWHYHSPGYKENWYHNKKWEKNDGQMLWDFVKGVATVAGVGAVTALTGGAAGAVLTSTALTSGEIGTLVGVGGYLGTVGGSMVSGKEVDDNKSRYYRWSCCGNKIRNSQGCKMDKICVWCNKSSKTKGCKSAWVPLDFEDNRQKYLIN